MKNDDLEAELADVPRFTAAPSEDQSTRLTKMGQELWSVDARIVELEHELEQKKQRRVELVQKELPEFMTQIGQDKVGLAEFGVDLVLEPYYHANIKAEWPDEQRQEAFDWLENNGHGDLIKCQVEFLFPRYLMDLAKWFVEAVSKIKIPATFVKKKGKGTPVPAIPEPTLKQTVPWNTLTAFVKEQVEKGEQLPLETLGATVGQIVKIKQRK